MWVEWFGYGANLKPHLRADRITRSVERTTDVAAHLLRRYAELQAGFMSSDA